jgi:hypothetical protein
MSFSTSTGINPHRRFHIRQKLKDLLEEVADESDHGSSSELEKATDPVALQHEDQTGLLNQRKAERKDPILIASEQNKNARIIADLNKSIDSMKKFFDQSDQRAISEQTDSIDALAVDQHRMSRDASQGSAHDISQQSASTKLGKTTPNGSDKLNLGNQKDQSSYIQNVVRYVSDKEYIPVAKEHEPRLPSKRKDSLDSVQSRRSSAVTTNKTETMVTAAAHDMPIDGALADESAILTVLFKEITIIYNEARGISKELEYKKDIAKKIEYINQSYIKLFEKMLSETKRIYRQKLDIHQHELLESRGHNMKLKDQIQGKLKIFVAISVLHMTNQRA